MPSSWKAALALSLLLAAPWPAALAQAEPPLTLANLAVPASGVQRDEVAVAVDVQNSGTIPRSASLEVLQDGQVVSTKGVTIPAGTTVRHEVTMFLLGYGDVAVVVRISGGAELPPVVMHVEPVPGFVFDAVHVPAAATSGTPVELRATLQNPGADAVTGVLSLVIGGSVVSEQGLSLGPHGFTNGSFSWTFQSSGFHYVQFWATPYNGSVVGSQVNYVEVAESPAPEGPTVQAAPDVLPLGQTTTLTLTVLQGGAPSPGRAVRLCGPGPGCAPDATTNADGRVQLTVSPTYWGNATVYVDGAQARQIPARPALEASVTPQRPRVGDVLTVRVTAGGSPVAGAHVALSGAQTGGAFTAATGEAVFTLDVPGALAVAATHADNAPATLAVDVASWTTLLDVPVRALAAGPARSLAVRALGADGKPVPGASVVACGEPLGQVACAPAVAADAEGRAVLALDLARGGTLEVAAGSARVEVVVHPRLAVAASNPTPRVNAPFTLTVLGDGKPLPGAALRALRQDGPGEARWTTDATGSLLVSLGAGAWRVVTDTGSPEPAETLVTVGLAEAYLTLSGLQSPDAAPEGPFEVRARLRSDAEVDVVARVHLLVDGTPTDAQDVRTLPGKDTEVRFTVDGLDPRAHDVTMALEGREPLPAAIVVVTRRPDATPTVAGRVLADTPADLAGAAIVLLRDRDGVLEAVGEAVPGADGLFQATGLTGEPTDALVLKNGHGLLRSVEGLDLSALDLPLPPAALGADALGLAPEDLGPLADAVEDVKVVPVGALSPGEPRDVALGGYAGIVRVRFEPDAAVPDARLTVVRLAQGGVPGVPPPRIDAERWFAITLATPDGALVPIRWMDVAFQPPDGSGAPALAHHRLDGNAWDVHDPAAEDDALVARVASLSLFAVGTRPRGMGEAIAALAGSDAAVPIASGALALLVLGGAVLAGRPLLARLRRRPTPAPAAARAPQTLPRDELVVSGLTVEAGGKPLVRDVSFHVGRGQILAILGPSGGGKSTTLRALMGETPSRGEVDVFGLDRAALRSAVGYVAQETELYPEMTVRENVEYFGRQYEVDDDALQARVDEVLRALGLEERAGGRVSTLSGGQQRRASIAAALAHTPALLVLDEPTSGLDPTTRRNLWRFLRKAATDLGVAVLVTTHFLEEAALADRVVILNHGRVVAHGTPQELLAALPGGGTVVAATLADLPHEKEDAFDALLDALRREGLAAAHERSGLQVRLFTREPHRATRRLLDGLAGLDLATRRLATEDATMQDVFLHHAGEAFEESP